MGPGDLIASRFELIEPVGAGGMGVVFRGRDRQDDRPVAVKLVPASPQVARRFKREAEVLASLEHPGVVRYVDDGKASRGQRYLVMEWLEGQDLEARLDKGRLSVRETVVLGRQVADALGAVHELDVIHRDLKPANIFLVDGAIDSVKVLDFGIAHISATFSLTQTGVTLGTPGYMSPEQVKRTTKLTGRSDLFSLGTVMFECLAGRPPYVAASAVQVMQQVLREPAPPLSDVRPDAPPSLERLLDQLLAKSPDKRPTDGAAVAAALRAIEAELDERAEAEPVPLIVTGDEQAFVAIIASEKPVEDAATLVDVPAIPLTRPSPIPGPVASRAYGAIPTRVGGAPALLLPQQGSVQELAVRSARCALEMRARDPSERVALVMGHARLRDTQPVGELAGRPGALLRDAVPGELRIDSTTAGLLPSRFVVDSAGPFPTLLREDPLDAPARLLSGRATTFVGRDSERARLERVVRDALAGAPRGALIVGDAGIGKSRLAYELGRRLREDEVLRPMQWTARGDAASPPYGLVAQWIREAASIGTENDAAAIERALRSLPALRRTREGGELAIAFLLEMLDQPVAAGASEALDAARADPRLMADRMRWSVMTLLSELSRSRPLILCAEDLHVADRPSLAILSAIAREPGLPVALVGTATTPIDDDREDALEPLLREDLGPLSSAAAEAMAREHLANADPSTLARVVSAGQGNPFFLEELVRRVSERGEVDSLPDTVLGVARERFEALPPPARRILRAGSVFGGRFKAAGVCVLLGEDADPAEIRAWLTSLVDSRVLGWDTEGAESEPVYRFRHEVQREAAYAALTAEDRRAGHLLAGRWLAQRNTTQAIRLARHFERADEPELAREHQVRAAEDALSSFDFDAVFEHAEAAIRGGAERDLRGKLRLLQARAADLRGDVGRARVYAEQALGALDDLDSLTEAAPILFNALEASGRTEEADTFARSVVRRVTGQPLDGAQLERLLRLGAGLARTASRELAEEILFIAEDPRLEDGLHATRARAMLAALHARLALQDGDTATHLERTREQRELMAEGQDARGVAWCDAAIGYVLMELGAYAEAEHAIVAAGAMARELGLASLAAQADHNLGLTLAYLGRTDEGTARERQAIESFTALGERRMVVASRIYLAKILLRGGDAEGAVAEATEALTKARSAPTLRAFAAATLARAELARGQTAAVMEPAELASKLLHGPVEAGEAEIRLVWAEALRADGREEEALDVIRDANARLLERASRIGDAAHRRSFLENVPEHARTAALYTEWTR